MSEATQTITERILGHVQAHSRVSAAEIFDAVDSIGDLKDVSSTLSRLYRQGQVDREACIENGRSLYRYTFRQAAPAKTAKTTASKAKAHLDAHDKIRNSIDVGTAPGDELANALAAIAGWEELAGLYGCETPEQLFEYIETNNDTTQTKYMVSSGPVLCDTMEDARREARLMLNSSNRDTVFVGALIGTCSIEIVWNQTKGR